MSIDANQPNQQPARQRPPDLDIGAAVALFAGAVAAWRYGPIEGVNAAAAVLSLVRGIQRH